MFRQPALHLALTASSIAIPVIGRVRRTMKPHPSSEARWETFIVASFYFHHLSTIYVVLPYFNSLSLSLTLLFLWCGFFTFVSHLTTFKFIMPSFLAKGCILTFLSLEHLHSLRTDLIAPVRITVPKGAAVDLVRDKCSYAYACRVDERMHGRAWRFGLWTGYAHCPLTLLAVS